jgi:hypothetical protein
LSEVRLSPTGTVRWRLDERREIVNDVVSSRYIGLEEELMARPSIISTTPRAAWRSEVNCLKLAAVTGLPADLVLRSAGHQAKADVLRKAFPGRVGRIPADRTPPSIKAAVQTLLQASARGVPLPNLTGASSPDARRTTRDESSRDGQGAGRPPARSVNPL